MVRAVLPTPPSPSTTSLYSTILPAMVEGRMRARETEKRRGSRRRVEGGERGRSQGSRRWYSQEFDRGEGSRERMAED
jgi:hypothetical protein